MTGIQVVKVSPDEIAFIGLQVLVAAFRVTGLSTGIDTVKVLGAKIQVEAECREMVIPVGVFDYHLNVFVDLLGGTQDYVHGCIIHQFQTVVCP